MIRTNAPPTRLSHMNSPTLTKYLRLAYWTGDLYESQYACKRHPIDHPKIMPQVGNIYQNITDPNQIHQVTKQPPQPWMSWVKLSSRLWILEITVMNETCTTRRLSFLKEFSCMCRLGKTNLKSNELRKKKKSKKGKKMLVSPMECLPNSPPIRLSMIWPSQALIPGGHQPSSCQNLQTFL